MILFQTCISGLGCTCMLPIYIAWRWKWVLKRGSETATPQDLKVNSDVETSPSTQTDFRGRKTTTTESFQLHECIYVSLFIPVVGTPLGMLLVGTDLDLEFSFLKCSLFSSNCPFVLMIVEKAPKVIIVGSSLSPSSL